MAAGSLPAGQRRSRRLLVLFVVVMFAFPFVVVASSAMLSSVFPGWAARAGLGPRGPLIERLADEARYDRAPLAIRQQPRPDGSATASTSYPVPSEDEALGKLSRACEAQRLKIASPDARRADPGLLCVGEDRGAEVRVQAEVVCRPACALTLRVDSRPVAMGGQV